MRRIFESIRFDAKAMKQVALALAFIFLTGCGAKPTLSLNNTYLNPTDPLYVRKSKGGLVLLPMGEYMRLAPIFEIERAYPKRVRVMKIRGSYFVTASGFRNVWILDPVGDGSAFFSPIETANTGCVMAAPRFEYDSRMENCLRVIWRTADGGKSSKILSVEGGIFDSCSPKK